MDLQTKFLRIDREKTTHGSFIDPEYVLHIVFQGRFDFQIQNENYSIEQGDLILIPPNNLHAVKNAENIHMAVLHFYDHSNTLESLGLEPVLHFKGREFGTVKSLSTQLEEYWSLKSSVRQFAVDGLVHTIIGMFILQNRKGGKVSSNRQFTNWKSIQEGVTYIQNNFKDPGISIAEVSRICNLSYNYFSYLFKQYTHESPLHYLTRLRLEYAKECIYNGRFNISQAAAASGFANIQYFSRTFKNYEGLSPRAWLKQYS
ncbi:MAG: AraC family transcriptional regulator [Spirochaetales bacterium]|nr:AraC family transcriptional regulator [Spirochaetales bacterium]